MSLFAVLFRTAILFCLCKTHALITPASESALSLFFF